MKKALFILLAVLVAMPLKAQRNTGFYDDYVQYSPMAMYLGLSLLGAQHKGPYSDLLIAGSVASISEAIMVNSLKFLVPEQRPNGTSFNSMPSGHTATAFTGAELVRMEYGWGWGAGAYGLASFVAYSRVAHKCHWWWDAAAGAAIGIASAHIGYSCVIPVRKLFGMKLPEGAAVSVAPVADPYMGSFYTTVSFSF